MEAEHCDLNSQSRESGAAQYGTIAGNLHNHIVERNANPIVWALSRPLSATNIGINLYAFNPDAGGTQMKQLVKIAAGTWPSFQGNINQPPVVANGEVFVASDHQLQIFGLKATKKK
jgi:hypothetical protein